MNKITRKPMISILMAVYNTEEFLPTAIDSVIKQTYEQWELICINDGSTDNSLNLLRQYQDKDSRIIVIDHPHCGTAAGSRNVGLDITRGHYIAMLDSDDKIEPAYFEKLVSRQHQTDADIVISSVCFWDYVNNKIHKILAGVDGYTRKILTGRESFVLSLRWQIGGIGLHNAKILRQIKYCECGMNGDEYTTRLLFLHAARVAFCDAIYYYRNNPSSTTKKFSYRHFSRCLTDAMLLTLIRKNKFRGDFFIGYKEEIFMLTIKNFINLFDKRNLLSSKQKKNALCSLIKATMNIGKELFLPPFSIKSILNIFFQLLTKTARWIRNYKHK